MGTVRKLKNKQQKRAERQLSTPEPPQPARKKGGDADAPKQGKVAKARSIARALDLDSEELRARIVDGQLYLSEQEGTRLIRRFGNVPQVSGLSIIIDDDRIRTRAGEGQPEVEGPVGSKQQQPKAKAKPPEPARVVVDPAVKLREAAEEEFEPSRLISYLDDPKTADVAKRRLIEIGDTAAIELVDQLANPGRKEAIREILSEIGSQKTIGLLAWALSDTYRNSEAMEILIGIAKKDRDNRAKVVDYSVGALADKDAEKNAAQVLTRIAEESKEDKTAVIDKLVVCGLNSNGSAEKAKGIALELSRKDGECRTTAVCRYVGSLGDERRFEYNKEALFRLAEIDPKCVVSKCFGGLKTPRLRENCRKMMSELIALNIREVPIVCCAALGNPEWKNEATAVLLETAKTNPRRVVYRCVSALKDSVKCEAANGILDEIAKTKPEIVTTECGKTLRSPEHAENASKTLIRLAGLYEKEVLEACFFELANGESAEQAKKTIVQMGIKMRACRLTLLQWCIGEMKKIEIQMRVDETAEGPFGKGVAKTVDTRSHIDEIIMILFRLDPSLVIDNFCHILASPLTHKHANEMLLRMGLEQPRRVTKILIQHVTPGIREIVKELLIELGIQKPVIESVLLEPGEIRNEILAGIHAAQIKQVWEQRPNWANRTRRYLFYGTPEPETVFSARKESKRVIVRMRG